MLWYFRHSAEPGFFFFFSLSRPLSDFGSIYFFFRSLVPLCTLSPIFRKDFRVVFPYISMPGYYGPPPHSSPRSTRSYSKSGRRRNPLQDIKIWKFGVFVFFFELLIRSPRRIYDRARGFPCCYEEGRSTNQDRVWLVCLPSRRWNFFNFFSASVSGLSPCPGQCPSVSGRKRRGSKRLA